MSRLAASIGLVAYFWDAILGALHFVSGAADRSNVTPDAIKVPAATKRFAVVCVHDTTPRPDIRSLIATLRRAGFLCVLVSSNEAPRQYADLADVTIRISRYSRDFTAYRAAFRYLDKLVPPSESIVTFLNDSVWYFEKYQADIVDRLVTSIPTESLCVGGFIADEIPHVSGWLFGVPFTADWRADLSVLFDRHFLRRARRYHIAFGEHRILPSMKKSRALTVLQKAEENPAIAACYEAVISGSACFYLKADSQWRTEPSGNRLAQFLDVNAVPEERNAVLRWLAGRSAILASDWTRRYEFSAYRRRHF